MKQEIESALRPLFGKPLSDMWRYAGCQKFEFGVQRSFINPKGQEASQADYGLVVSCFWRISGPDEYIVSSDDFGPAQERRDENAKSFYEKLGDHLITVERVLVSETFALCFHLTGGYLLQVVTSNTSNEGQWGIYERNRRQMLRDGEQWRFVPRDEDEEHFVITWNPDDPPGRPVIG